MNQVNHYLLTGANGFVARGVNKWLSEQGFEVTGLDLSQQNINVDISKPFYLDKELEIDIVVHTAGKAHSVPKSEKEAKLFYDVNYEGTQNLAFAIEKLPVKPKAFIFISTVAVYGLDYGILIDEDHPLSGDSPYAKSKILAEEWLSEWCARNKIVLGILRLPLVAGPNPPGNLGAMISGIRSGLYISVGKADSRKSIVWYEDIASIFPRISRVGGIYNVTDGLHPSFNELELTIAEKFGKRSPIRVPTIVAKLLALAGDIVGTKSPINSNVLRRITSTLTFDDRKARNILGWKPTSVIERLKTTL